MVYIIMDQEKGVSVDQTNEKQLSNISVQECTSMTNSDEDHVDYSFGTKELNLGDLEKGVLVDQTNENSSAIVCISVQESASMINSDEDQVDNSFGTKELNLDDKDRGVLLDQTNENPSVIVSIVVEENTSMKSSDEHQVDNSFGTKELNLDDKDKGVLLDQTNENPSVIVSIVVEENTSMKSSDEHQVDNSFGTKELNLDDKDKGVLLDQTNENPSVIVSIVVEESTSMKSSDEHQVDNSFGTKGSNLDDSVKEDENERCGSCIVNLGDENGEKMGDIGSQQLCRICHLNALENGKSLVDLIVLGCGCKGDIAFAHSHCAEAWFKLKGNRICEICGEHANNVTGAVDIRFMEEWNENRSIVDSERRRGCWQSQPLCNFLMACLMIAFVLPWFFRVNMF